jgi:hypothetical protein
MKFTKETVDNFLNEIDGNLKNIIPISYTMFNKLESYHYLWLYGGYRNYDDLSFIVDFVEKIGSIYADERMNPESDIYIYGSLENDIQTIMGIACEIIDTIEASDRFNNYYEFYKTHKKISDLLIENCSIFSHLIDTDINFVASKFHMKTNELLELLEDFKQLRIVNIQPYGGKGRIYFKLGTNFYTYAYYIGYRNDELLETPNSISIQDEEGNDD